MTSPIAHAEPAMGTVFSFAVVGGAVPEDAIRGGAEPRLRGPAPL